MEKCFLIESGSYLTPNKTKADTKLSNSVEIYYILKNSLKVV